MIAQQTGRAVAVLAGLLAGILAVAGGDAGVVKSGPQVGAKIKQSFEVKLLSGPDAGDMACLV